VTLGRPGHCRQRRQGNNENCKLSHFLASPRCRPQGEANLIPARATARRNSGREGNRGHGFNLISVRRNALLLPFLILRPRTKETEFMKIATITLAAALALFGGGAFAAGGGGGGGGAGGAGGGAAGGSAGTGSAAGSSTSSPSGMTSPGSTTTPGTTGMGTGGTTGSSTTTPGLNNGLHSNNTRCNGTSTTSPGSANNPRTGSAAPC
jgi:hypothetical protein